VRWPELRRVLQGKLQAERRSGKKHDLWFVACDGKLVSRVLDSHGDGEMRGHEIGHVAQSLGLRERELRELVRCHLTREEFCAKQS
jgi:hypothetical protein